VKVYVQEQQRKIYRGAGYSLKEEGVVLNCKGTTAHCIDLPLREHYTTAMHKHSTCMLIDCTTTVNNDRATKRALQDISGLNFTLRGCALLVCYAYAPPLQLLSLA
jgi:hypothetical protein